MNRFEKISGLKGEARVRYLDGEFQDTSRDGFATARRRGSWVWARPGAQRSGRHR